MIFQALEEHNARPHGSLPEIALEDGTVRRTSPNERARSLAEPVKVMPESYLPLFFSRGVACAVTRNGVRFNSATYGRFDEVLAAMQGRTVTVFGMPDLPGAVYIEQLGRCVERDIAVAPGSEGALMAAKRSIEKAQRSQFEQLIARVREQGSAAQVEAVRLTSDPWPERPRVEISAPAAADRAARLAAAAAQIRGARAASAARFNVDDFAAARPRDGERRGILAQADRFVAQAALAGPEPHLETAGPFAGLVQE